MKKICLLFLLISMLFLTACWREDTTQLAKDEFSKYYNGKEEVVLNRYGSLYFENRVVKREEFVPRINDNSIVFYDGAVYYLSVEVDDENRYINVNSCDYYAENTKTIYKIELNVKKYALVTKKYKDSYYIWYKKNRLTYIDRYTISTGVYENIASGKNCELSDYIPQEESKYVIKIIENKSPQEHEKFIITDSETGIERVIDDEYLKNTIYIDSMEMFNYGPLRADISNGHILLTYEIGAGDGWNVSHLVFEYDFESNRLEYKLLAFPDERVGVEVIYID